MVLILGTLCNACGVKWKHGKILQHMVSAATLKAGKDDSPTISSNEEDSESYDRKLKDEPDDSATAGVPDSLSPNVSLKPPVTYPNPLILKKRGPGRPPKNPTAIAAAERRRQLQIQQILQQHPKLAETMGDMLANVGLDASIMAAVQASVSGAAMAARTSNMQQNSTTPEASSTKTSSRIEQSKSPGN